MANRLQLRRDGAQQWANVNPILAQGELGIELDTSRLKIGDGVTPWNSLKYERPLETESNTANTLVKRDADGNFEAGAITASIVGNAATATRLANARSFTLTGDMTGSASFDGSANINITAELNYQPGLPHYDANNLSATGTYTQITLDSRGRVTTASNPSTLAGYGITDATPSDPDLIALAAITSLGLLSRTGNGTAVTRQITGASGQIVMTNGSGASGDPQVGLADTPVVVGSYNPTGSISLDQPQLSVSETGSIHQTVNTPDFTVDRYGRLTYAATAPIATATQGTESALWDSGTTYARYGKVKNSNDRLYEAIAPINSGGSEPTHTDTSDTGYWRYLGSALSPQKGLASFNQEDFDVTAWNSAGNYEGGFVTIAQAGVDNTQLQNNRVSFADGNTKEDFELDQELTATTGYRGFNYLNYIKINDTSGNLLVGANNTGDSGSGEIDINVRSYYSDPDITLDGSVDQKLDKTGDGNLTFQLTQSSSSDRTILINATNSGAGNAAIDITSENDITINATNVSNRVNVEGFQFQDDTLSSTAATMILDPGDDDAATGKVQIRGDLQVDGTTTTVNSTVVTIDDPIIVLGGDTTPVSDDNKDRGVEFSYYDTQARKGFYGWDEDYANANMWSGTGGYRFLYNATNTSEVFTGTDAPIIAGNLRLTTNTGSTWKTPTTGTLVVTGGVGISENLNVGGTSHLNGNVEIDGTVDIDANFAVRSGTTDKFTVASSTGNTVIEGTLDVQLETEITDNLIIKADNKKFDIQTAAGVSKFEVDTDNGNIHTDGTLDVDSGVTLNSTLDVDNNVTLNAELDVDGNSLFHNNITLDTTGKNFKITNGSQDKFSVLSTNGNTDIRGTLDVGSNVVLETNLQVNGNTTLGNQASDNLTVNADAVFTDNLTVNQAVDFDSTLNVDQAVDFNSTLVVDGQTTIYDSLILQSDNEVLNINNDAAQTQFSIDFDNGNTIIGRSGQGTGTLTVHGNSTFNDLATFTDNVIVGNANTDTLTVNSVSQFTDDVTVDGSLTVNTNALIEGNLTVNGVTTTVNSTTVTLDDPIITLGGDTAPASDDAKDRGVEFRYFNSSAKLGFFGWDDSALRYVFLHDATNNSEVFGGTKSGIDAGSLKLFNTTNATNSATGTLIVGGGAGIGLDLYVGDDLVVGDDGSFGGNVDITGTLDVTDDFAVASTFTVDAQTGNTFANGTFTVNGDATIGNQAGDSHTVTGTVQFNQAVTGSARFNIRNLKVGTDAANEISTSSGNLILDSAGGTVNITDHADVDGDLNVDGNTKVDGTLTVDGNTTIGNASGDSHSVTGTVQFNQAITSTDITADAIKIGVDANNEISTTTGNLILDSQGGKVHITDNAEVDGSLQVDGNTTLGDASSDSLTVNATSDFNAAITSEQITAKNIKIGVDSTSEISTATGNLTLDSATGETIVDDNLTINGTLDVDNLTTITDGLTVRADNKLVAIQTAGGINKLTVDTDNGNTDIQGTLDVNGATTITNTLNVTNNVDLDQQLNVDGNATFQSNVNINGDNLLFTIENQAGTDQFTVDSDNGNTVIGGTLVVDETVDVTGIVTSNNFLKAVNSTNPANLSANAALMVTGGATVGADLFVGTGFKVGANAATKFSVAGGTGDTLITGTLGVTGNTTLSTLDVSTIDTTGATSIGGTFNVGTNKFTVLSNSGNLDMAGTLDVGGRTIIDDTLQVTQNVDFDSDLNVDGNTQIDGTLTVDSATTIKDNVIVRGSTKTFKLQNGSNQDKITLHSTSGNAEITGTSTLGALDVTNNTTIGGTLGVTGQITGNVTGSLTGNADTASLVDVTETAATNLDFFPTFVSATSGNTEIRTDSTNLKYNPSSNRLTVTNFRSTTDFEVQGNLTITGAITYGQAQVGSIANHDTDALTEGSTNLYFTNERVDDRVNALITGGTGITATYDDAGNILTLSATQADINTDNITEGSSNLFTTAARTRTHFTYGTGIKLTAADLAIDFTEFNTDSVVEGSTNLFITAARTRGHLSASGDLSYNASTGVFSYTIPTTIASLSNHDTADLAEGTNLYFTNARADARADARIAAADTDDLSEGSTNLYFTNARADARIAAASTSDLSEGTNLYFTNARADARIAAASTSDLSEGTNLYHTTARARSAISAGGDLSYNASTGVMSVTLPTVFSGAYNDLSGKPTLGSAAATASTDYATAAQGTLAASATQPGDLATVATSGAYNDLTGKPSLFSGAYNDLSGKPTLGTAAATASTDYATAAQGALAASALQAETITLATLKSVAAGAADFAAFKSAIAAL